MCEKDGGVVIYEPVKIGRKEYEMLGGNAGGVSIPLADTRREFPYFREKTETKIRDQDPEVVRAETAVKRRSDGKVLGKSIQYWRSAGDFPSGSLPPSAFICPQHTSLSKQLFSIEED